MILRPATASDLSEEMMNAWTAGERVDQVDLANLDQVLQYTPEDLTVTVQAGMTLASLQAHLRVHGQWLPIDPPNPEQLTLSDVLAKNLSGPRRFGFGTVREHLLGLTAVLADGRLIHNGGKVVKNVAGYDLCKLFVGCHGTLGVIVEATFKLRPLPEKELLLERPGLDLATALETVEQLQLLSPIVLDLHNLHGSTEEVSLVVGLAGSADDVSWHLNRVQQLGFQSLTNLDYTLALDPAQIHCHSVLPSRLGPLLESLGTVPFVARAGNGVVYALGGPPPDKPSIPLELHRRVKELFDPRGVLPALPW